MRNSLHSPTDILLQLPIARLAPPRAPCAGTGRREACQGTPRSRAPTLSPTAVGAVVDTMPRARPGFLRVRSRLRWGANAPAALAVLYVQATGQGTGAAPRHHAIPTTSPCVTMRHHQPQALCVCLCCLWRVGAVCVLMSGRLYVCVATRCFAGTVLQFGTTISYACS